MIHNNAYILKGGIIDTPGVSKAWSRGANHGPLYKYYFIKIYLLDLFVKSYLSEAANAFLMFANNNMSVHFTVKREDIYKYTYIYIYC